MYIRDAFKKRASPKNVKNEKKKDQKLYKI